MHAASTCSASGARGAAAALPMSAASNKSGNDARFAILRLQLVEEANTGSCGACGACGGRCSLPLLERGSAVHPAAARRSTLQRIASRVSYRVKIGRYWLERGPKSCCGIVADLAVHWRGRTRMVPAGGAKDRLVTVTERAGRPQQKS